MAIEEDLLITFGADIIHLRQSELLFEENAAPDYYFQIQKGKIKLTNHKPGDGEFIQSIHEEGDSVGEVFLFCKHHRYPVNAVVSEDSSVFRLERSKLLKLLESDFDLQLKFLRNCAE
ncbi:cyclic nucleotide-binding domain-containing protein, partial [Corallococcus praedator]